MRVMLPLTVFGGAARESRMGPAGEYPRATVSQRLATGGVIASPRGQFGNTRPGGAARWSHDLAPECRHGRRRSPSCKVPMALIRKGLPRRALESVSCA
jgi:hypothetical protein